MALTDQLDRLAAFEPAPYPVVSLYLDARPGPTGRDQFQTFIRKEFSARSGTYPQNSPERETLERDFERISRYLESDLQGSANGVAIFACSAAGLFEAVQLDAPFERHWLYIGDQPHLYPLARLASQYPRYAALLADTNTARILVIATGGVVATEEVKGTKTKRSSQGGWSQARFQRHTENFHLQHAKEVVDALDRVVQQEGIDQILISGDEVITPLLREQMPKHLAARVVEEIRLDTRAPVDQIVRASLEAMRRLNERTDREKVEAAIGGYRGGGLGVVGPEPTMEALIKGQVDELLLAASLGEIRGRAGGIGSPSRADDGNGAEPAVEPVAAGEPAEAGADAVRLADDLVTKASQTGARITFIEDGSLLAGYGGVAALLRFRI